MKVLKFCRYQYRRAITKMGGLVKDHIGLGLKAGGAAVAGIWGGLHPLIQGLLALMGLDILTGLLAAVVTRKLSSEVSFSGLAKKGLILALVCVGKILESTAAPGFPVGEIVAGAYIVHECLSIMENCARANLPVPEVIRAALAKVQTSAPGQNLPRPEEVNAQN